MERFRGHGGRAPMGSTGRLAVLAAIMGLLATDRCTTRAQAPGAEAGTRAGTETEREIAPASEVAPAGARAPGAPAARGALRDGFEGPNTTWEQEYTDAPIRLLDHDRSNRAAHGGRLSERFHFEAGIGSRFFVGCPLPNVPVTGDLRLSIFVRSNKQGPRLFAKVVLPADVDPETKAPSFVLVPGTAFGRVDRWERLELIDLPIAIEQQAQILRASSRRPVPLDGAYISQIVVNLMGGQGETEVFLDDLEIAPVAPEVIAAWSAAQGTREGPSPDAEADAAAPAGAAQAADAGASAGAEDAAEAAPTIRLSRNLFERLGEDRRYRGWFPTAIEAPGANLSELRRAGFNVLVTEARPDPKRLRAAVQRGFWLLPRLEETTGALGAEHALEQVNAYPMPDHVVLWHLGDHLGRGREEKTRQIELEQTRAVIGALRRKTRGTSRLSMANLDGMHRLYARVPTNLDAIGVEPPVWGGSQTLGDGLSYINQCRNMTVPSNPEALFWAWLPLTVPGNVVRNIWGRDAPPDWGMPTVTPAQARMMTYMALAAGCRGLTMMGDADLTRPAGEPLLIELTLLNAEIDLCEQILARNTKRAKPYGVFDPEPPDRPTTANVMMKRMPKLKEWNAKTGLIAAPVPLENNQGMLLIVADLAGDAQWAPPQMAYHDLTIYPMLSAEAQVLEISPGGARFLEHKPDDRVPGGLRVTVPNFGATTLLLCTTDLEFCRHIQGAVERIRPQAAALAIRQAELHLQSARALHERLTIDGHPFRSKKDVDLRHLVGIDARPTDARDLLAEAEKFLANARAAQDVQDYSHAWDEARMVNRPLRILTYAYWLEAMAEVQKAATRNFNPKRPKPAPGTSEPYPPPPVIVTAVSCPPAISTATLPQLHIWKDWIAGVPGYRFGANRVPSGTFDNPDELARAGWLDVSHHDPNIVHTVAPEPRKPELAPKPEKKKKKPRGKKENWFEDEIVAPGDGVIKLTVAWKNRDQKEFDRVGPPALNFPMAAVRSPDVRVQANNLVRISVLVKRPLGSPPGLGGVIVRDSIGGEPFQYRTSGVVPNYSRVVLYRKAPADGTFHVLLGLAGYGEVLFDDFRVQVVEDSPADPELMPEADPGLVQDRRPRSSAPRPPDPRVPDAEAAAVAPDATRRNR